MSRRLPTGIDVLDRKLSGGIPAGSVVALSAAPASQSELLLYELTAPRETLYLTTERSVEAVRDAFERTTAPTGTPEIEQVASDAPLDEVSRLVETVPNGATVIVDPVDALERRDPARYRRFMNGLQTAMVNTESVAVLHCLAGNDPPAGRDLTEYMADVVFSLETTISGESIENRLAVPKFRGGRALSETIKLELAERVRIDTSRDIA
ncbi:ATPase domain-containing protein [Halalkalicoccus sp. NIPERK01]|uniref:RAD55 family ATPase n=1 Tax=Halalkalicoccus sp. NIPERK01 TaxID=3053469 RepID=UPI00256ED816|nr:ATPase domain-containing protein [Halalkalicoccus sp. NIPERK01]MDL5361032.1 ATPase domain-containing protein [Halalkalicoccus sp. NIPERK01]